MSTHDAPRMDCLVHGLTRMTARPFHGSEDAPVRQVNNILQNLRGEHFRHVQNVQGKRAVSSSSLSSRTYNGPTLSVDLIYPSPSPSPATGYVRSRVPGPSPPKSWRSPASSGPSSSRSPSTVDDADVSTNSPAWRQRALSLLFSADISRSIYPDPNPRLNSILIPADPTGAPIPSLTTLLCLQLVRTDLVDLAPHLPPHLRRALMRHAAVHVPLSQTELDALRQGATHVDAELVVVGPGNVLRPSFFHQRRGHHDDVDDDDDDDGHCDSDPLGPVDLTRSRTDSADADGDAMSNDDDAWDTVQMQDSEPSELRSLAVLSGPLSAATLLAFPPTITHLALLGVPHRIPLQRLPTICPLLVFLDLSYNAWLSVQMLEDEIKWGRLRRLEVVGLRRCPVTPKVLVELNRGRWEDVRVFQ